jgi:hemerythrin-like domain-containing protein
MTAANQPIDTWEMVLAHRVFRRQFRLLPALIRAVPPHDTTRAAVLATHLTDVVGGLHHHHTTEDELLWPPLLARVGLQADLVRRMEAQHARLADLLGRVGAAVPGWRSAAGEAERDALAMLITETSAALDEHLDDEETEILPLVSRHITQAEWDRLNRRAREALPKSPKALFFLGLVLDQARDPQEAARMLRQLPPPARWLWRLFGRRYHRRASAVLLGTDRRAGRPADS